MVTPTQQAPPTSRAPAILQTLAHFTRPRRTLDRDRAQFGRVYTRRNLVFGDQVVISDPALVKTIFAGNSEDFKAGQAAAVVRVFLGDRSLVVLDGQEHRHMRKLMMPSFQGRYLERYAAAMCQVTDQAIDRWRPGDCVEMQVEFQQLTLDIILHAVLGLNDDDEIGRFRIQLTEFINQVQSPTGALWLLGPFQKDLGRLTPWASIKEMLSRTDAMLHSHVRSRRAELPTASGGNLLHLLLLAKDPDGACMDDDTIVEQIKTLLLAGHETTATSLSWGLEELLRAPAEVDKIASELKDVCGHEPLQATHLKQLKYLDATVMEILRLHPVVDSVARVLTKPLIASGYNLPAGTIVSPSIYLIHHDSTIYPNPTQFSPERFLNQRPEPSEWLPFGGGIRRCIGMGFALFEMKIVLARLIARTKLRLQRRRRPLAVPRALLVSPRGGTRVHIDAVAPNCSQRETP